MALFNFMKKKKEGVTIFSPMKGKVVPLSQVPDPVFADGIMGNGMAIDPTEGKVFAPFDGIVSTLFPTGHAIGLSSCEGLELLIHIGMDTVKLDGKYFTKKVTDGEEVKKGDLLIEVDLEAVKEAGYSVITPVIICDPKEYSELKISDFKEILAGEQLCVCEKQ